MPEHHIITGNIEEWLRGTSSAAENAGMSMAQMAEALGQASAEMVRLRQHRARRTDLHIQFLDIIRDREF